MEVGDIGTVSAIPHEKAVCLKEYSGGYKHDTDNLEIVTEGGDVKHQRRTFKQLTETVTVKKGALWQEACDDGTQEYVLLNDAFNKDSRAQKIYNRSLVEDDPKHFVEVFSVEPQYMTREELDRWEVFRNAQVVRSVKQRLGKTVDTSPTKSTWTPARRAAQSRKIKAAWKARKAA